LQARGSRTSSCDSLSSESTLASNGNIVTGVTPTSASHEHLGLQVITCTLSYAYDITEAGYF